MKKSIHSPAYRVFVAQLVAARKAAGLTQQQLADRLETPQSFVAKCEGLERRIDVGEFLEIAKILRADPEAIIRRAKKAL
jgi:transcriptional regulator with XRE-family HTH domain